MAEVKGPIIGTVLVAGINPAGEPKYIDGTVLVAGLNASGEMEYLDPDNIGSGGGADLSTNNPANVGYAPVPGSGTLASKDDHVHDLVLTSQQTQLAADVAMPSANTYYDGPSLSLTAGIWLITSSVLYKAPAVGTAFSSKLWDGTTVYASGELSAIASASIQIPIVVVVTLTVTTTVKVSGACASTNGTILRAMQLNSAGNNASTLVAVRIG